MKEFKYKIGEVINDLVILENTRQMFGNKKLKACKYKCLKCNYVGIMREDVLSRGSSCPCCCVPPRIIVEDINSLVASNETKWMINIFKGGYEEAKLYGKGSTKKIKHICPYCGKEQTKERPIYQLYKNLPNCEFCGRGRSYPERLMSSLLDYLDIDYIQQLSSKYFEWCKNKRYDFYIPSLNCIIEVHGMQHYKDTNRSKYVDEYNNDINKQNMALNNNIENYIIIDCRYSDFDFIKNNILSSNLIKLINKDVDWGTIRKMVNDSFTKQVWNYWNDLNKPISITELANEFSISRPTAKKILEEGFAQNKLIFSMEEITNKNIEERNNRAKTMASRTKIGVYKDNILLQEFESMHELERNSEQIFGVKLFSSKISVVCDKDKKYKNFYFKRLPETTERVDPRTGDATV